MNKNQKILVVDDARLVRTQMLHHLNEMGFNNVISCENGLQAIKLHKSESPDLIIMDVVMPECDGIEALGKIRATDKKTPILMLSSVTDEEEQSKAFDQGVLGFVLKPITVSNYHKKLSPYLN